MDVPHDAGDEGFPPDAVEVGRIAGAWGVKGALRVQPHAGSPQVLLTCRCWFLRAAEGPGAGAVPPRLRVTSARVQGDVIVAGAQGIGDREAAQALRGARVFVSRARFPVPGADEYYWVDLIGCRVVNREGIELGDVTGLMDLGPHAVLQVRAGAPDADERLIPFVAAYVDDVDLVARRIGVDWSSDF